MEVGQSNFPDFDKTFGSFIDIYNNQNTPAEEKTTSLRNIENAVNDILNKKTSENEEAFKQNVDKLKGFIKDKKIIVQSRDIEIWNRMIKRIDQYSPFPTKGKIQDVQVELYFEMAKSLEKKDIGSLLQTNREFVPILTNPRALTYFLNRFSSSIPPNQRFELALRCGDLLEKLDLSNFPEITQDYLELLKFNCPNLESLDLSHTPIKTLNHLENIKVLNLSGCTSIEEGDNGLKKLQSLLKLESLNLSSTHIKSLDYLPKQLKKLELFQCKELSAQAFYKIKDFPNLVYLNISNNPVSSLKFIPKGIEELEISNCWNLTDEICEKLASFKKLKRIDLSDNDRITKIPQLPDDLEILNIDSCGGIQSQELKKLKLFSKLKHLNISGLPIRNLDHLPTDLEVLELSTCRELPQQELSKLSSFSRLIKLNLSETNVQDLSFLKDKKITDLDLSSCKNLKADQINKLESLPLKKLNISYLNLVKFPDIPKGLIELNLRGLRFQPPNEFNHLAKFLNLQNLDLSATTITSLHPIPKSILKLKIRNCDLSQKEIEKLHLFSQLQTLEIGKFGSSFEKKQEIALRKHLPKSLKMVNETFLAPYGTTNLG